MTHNIPEGVAYGTVHGEFMSFAADRVGTAAGPDGVPDKIPMEGYVVLTPQVETIRWPSLVPPITAVIQDVRCPLIEGKLYPPGTKPETAASVEPGVVLVATEQPEALPSTVQYTLTFDLKGIKRQPNPVTFEVPTGGVVDLTTVIPATPTPGTVVVVSTESRDRAEAAAALAELAAERAENASLGDINYDLILGRVEPLVDDAVAVGLSGVGDLVASALVPYATTAALSEGLAEKQNAGNYATTASLATVATTGAYADLTGKPTIPPTPDLSGFATKTELTSGLAEKQPVGDYATTAALTSGLATKQPVGDYATRDELPDLTAYATTAYVDQTVGDIDTVLAGILGGE